MFLTHGLFDTKGLVEMWHKIEEALFLTELGIPTQIISGIEYHVVYDTLQGHSTVGTLITK